MLLWTTFLVVCTTLPCTTFVCITLPCTTFLVSTTSLLYTTLSCTTFLVCITLRLTLRSYHPARLTYSFVRQISLPPLSLPSPFLNPPPLPPVSLPPTFPMVTVVACGHAALPLCNFRYYIGEKGNVFPPGAEGSPALGLFAEYWIWDKVAARGPHLDGQGDIML